MGIYDRDYYQDEPRHGGGWGSPRSVVTKLIIINVAIFVVDMFTPIVRRMSIDGPTASRWLDSLLALHADLFTHPWQFYQLLTYGFAHAPMDSDQFIFHVGFNMYMLWLFGRDVESRYGWKEFLTVYLGLIVLSGLVWAVYQNLIGWQGETPRVIGASGAVVGIVVLFALNFPQRKFTLLFLPMMPIPAWVLGVVLVGMDLLGALRNTGSNVAYIAHLAGAGFATLYFFSGLRPSRWLPDNFSLQSLAPKPKLRVHDPDPDYRALDEQADAILEKLHTQGEGSLSDNERKILEDYSRRMRQKHR